MNNWAIFFIKLTQLTNFVYKYLFVLFNNKWIYIKEDMSDNEMKNCTCIYTIFPYKEKSSGLYQFFDKIFI